MRALVVGAGPAGLLAATALSRQGFAVHLADPEPGNGARTRPQSVHVHLWPGSAWQRLKSWLPELEALTGPWPTRATLDDVLWRLCRPQVDQVHATRIRELVFRESSVDALTDAGWLAFDLVVDASGASRATLASVAKACGFPVTLHEGPPSGGYVTLLLAGIDLNGDEAVVAARDAKSGAGAILMGAAGSAARLTLQVPPGAGVPADLPMALRFLEAFDDPRLHEVCRAATLEGNPVRYGNRPHARLALEEMAGLPGNWIPVGDCLLATPPYLGHGLDQLTEHVELLGSGVEAKLSWAESRTRMVLRARERWWGATWIEAFRSPLANSGGH